MEEDASGPNKRPQATGFPRFSGRWPGAETQGDTKQLSEPLVRVRMSALFTNMSGRDQQTLTALALTVSAPS